MQAPARPAVSDQHHGALAAEQQVRQFKRDKPLNVGGVGHGTQRCTYEVSLPIAIRRQDGSYCRGSYTAPTIDNSECPALLGLASLVASRAILDCGRRTLYLCAEGDVQVITPPGSEVFDLETSATGHLILPVTNYTDADLSEERHGESQTRHLWADEPSGAAAGQLDRAPRPGQLELLLLQREDAQG